MKNKKIFLLGWLLAACFCIAACRSTNTVATNENKFDQYPASYVGVWQNSDSQYDSLPQSIQLFSNGKAIVDSDRDSYLVDEAIFTLSGEWLVEGNQLIVFYEQQGTSCAYNFTIKSSDTLTLKQGLLILDYTRK